MNKLKSHSTNILILVFALIVVALLSRVGFQAGNDGSEECQRHLKKTIEQIEIYSVDYQDKYPENWETLIPDYLRERPKCPVDDQSFYQLKRDPNLPEGVHEQFYFYVVTCNSPRHAEAQWYDNINGPGQGQR